MIFDVGSLFTNVSVHKTVNGILKRTFEDKLIQTNLKKRSLKIFCLMHLQKHRRLFLTTNSMNRKIKSAWVQH